MSLKGLFYQSKFSQAVVIYNFCKLVVDIWLRKKVKKKSSYVRFLSISLNSFFSGTVVNPALLLPGSVVISKGDITSVPCYVSSFNRSSNTLRFSHSTVVTDKTQNVNDTLHVFVYNSILNESWCGVGLHTRGTSRAGIINLTAIEPIGSNVFCYFSFVSPNKLSVSNSICIQYLISS